MAIAAILGLSALDALVLISSLGAALSAKVELIRSGDTDVSLSKAEEAEIMDKISSQVYSFEASTARDLAKGLSFSGVVEGDWGDRALAPEQLTFILDGMTEQYRGIFATLMKPGGPNCRELNQIQEELAEMAERMDIYYYESGMYLELDGYDWFETDEYTHIQGMQDDIYAERIKKGCIKKPGGGGGGNNRQGLTPA